MKSDNTAGNVTDPNSVLKKHLSAAQRKKKKRRITIIVVTTLVLAAVAIVVISLQRSVAENYASDEPTVENAEVTVGSISTTISGSGTLSDDDVEDVEVPSAVDIDTVYVEEGDTVAEGDLIATVDQASVLSAMADIQSQIDDIDDQLADASEDTVANSIKAGISGRIKKIYAEKGNDVAKVMYENGALALVSLDGLMAADITITDVNIAEGDEVTVTLSGGDTKTGSVENVKDSVITVTLTDNGTAYGDTVTVTDASGTQLGTGTLYIHSEFKITGYAGTISKVYVSENKKVSASTKLFHLTDRSYTADYDTLLNQRGDLEDDLDELIKLYQEGAVFSPISGFINSVDYDEESDSATSATTATDAAVTTTAPETTTTDSTDTSDTASEDSIKIVTVCPNATMSVAVSIDESDILSLEEGQEATVTIDSIGDDEFTGTVTDINTTGTSSGGVTVFTVEVTIDKTEEMFAGMSATVDIKIDGVENALIIPDEALQQTSNSSYVYTQYDKETGELGGMVEVETGISNGTDIEILSGLSEGDTVYYEPADEEDTGFNFAMGGMPDDFPQGAMPNGGGQ